MRNGVDPRGMVRIRADWCGIRVSPRGIRGIRAEHQGEGKLLQASHVSLWVCVRHISDYRLNSHEDFTDHFGFEPALQHFVLVLCASYRYLAMM